MDAVADRLASDRNRLAAGSASLAVGRNRELEHHLRAALAHAPDVAGMVAPGLRRTDADLNGNAGRAEPRMAPAGHFGIGIFECRDNARHTRSDHGVGTRRRFAVVRTWLERDVQGGAAGRFAGTAQRLDLGMGPAAGLGPAAADNHAVLLDDGPTAGFGQVRPRPCLPSASASAMNRRSCACGLRIGAHLRAISAASSPDNSASAVSKSLASRKLR